MNRRRKTENRGFIMRAAIVSAVMLLMMVAAVLWENYGSYWKRTPELRTETTVSVPSEYDLPALSTDNL